ncbi:hypothetical protein SCP_0800190 [Sparassis crispa]|uniref:MutL C-terminal dimerisation domain-containing protein n=1 Tax=Sparassis crispa TaxID=139825 RepID=A0A401GTF2_9APHY|nr:hypothetical protein SCP_0800190 [Sparassis crispa]GBE85502.1 hypothetical protein SCP_0800190 [Sparassis crispa]
MLASSLPPSNLANAEKELTNNFKAAALSLTTLYRTSRPTSKRAYNAGYAAAFQDMLLMIQQGVSTGESSDTAGQEEEDDQDEEKEKDREKERARPAANASVGSKTASKLPSASTGAPPTPQTPSLTTMPPPAMPSSPSPTSPIPLQRTSKTRLFALSNRKEVSVQVKFIKFFVWEERWTECAMDAPCGYNFETLQQTTKIDSQKLLRPLPLELTGADEMLATERVDTLGQNGFEIDVADDPLGDSARLRLAAQPISKSAVFGVKDLEELLHLIHNAPDEQIVSCSKVHAMFVMRACRKSTCLQYKYTDFHHHPYSTAPTYRDQQNVVAFSPVVWVFFNAPTIISVRIATVLLTYAR